MTYNQQRPISSEPMVARHGGTGGAAPAAWLSLLTLLLVAGCSSDSSQRQPTTHPEAQSALTELGSATGPQPGTADVEPVQLADRVFFETDSSALDESAIANLELLANWMHVNPQATLTIEGHCDERGTREYNIALGSSRAETIRRYLIASGVGEDRLSAISYGKERPAALGSGATFWAQNRRGVMVVQ